MYSSITGLVAAAFLANAIPDTNWQPDYRAARAIGEQLQKPVAIVVGNGTDGWKSAFKTADADAALAALKDRCVLVYADTATPEGQSLAAKVNMNGKSGLILGDRSGTNQAVRYVGAISAEEMTTALNQQVKAGMVALATESNEAPAAKPATAPTSNWTPPTSTSYFGGGCAGGNCGSGGCPGGNCGGGSGRRR